MGIGQDRVGTGQDRVHMVSSRANFLCGQKLLLAIVEKERTTLIYYL